MAQFIAFDKNVEVNGQTILSVVLGMKGFQDHAKKILADNGIPDPTPGNWYKQQNWLNAFKEIASKIGFRTLYQIGMKIPENADWPPQVNSIETAQSSVDIAYHMNHRLNGKVMFDPGNGNMLEGIGHYGYAKTGDREITMTCKNPYPCDFDMGIIEAVAKKFKPHPNAIVTIKHKSDSICRKTGSDECVYIVSWSF